MSRSNKIIFSSFSFNKATYSFLLSSKAPSNLLWRLISNELARNRKAHHRRSGSSDLATKSGGIKITFPG